MSTETPEHAIEIKNLTRKFRRKMAMDVNAIRNGAGTPAAVASPVVSSAVPEQGESRKVPVIQRVEVYVVEFDRGSQV